MKNRAFTLIELLVVVLIIGILVAIAVPKYRVAAVKSEVSTILPLMANIVQAEELFYLANGSYTNDLSDLDIELPSACSRISGATFKCGDFFIEWSVSNFVLLASYCPGRSDDFSTCKPYRDFQIGLGSKYQSYISWSRPGKFRCMGQNSSQLGTKICQSLGHLIEEERYSGYPLYEFQ